MPYIGSTLRRVLLLYKKEESTEDIGEVSESGRRSMVGNHVSKQLFRGFESLPLHYGRLAQLGEHLPYKQGVTGSIPVASIGRMV